MTAWPQHLAVWVGAVVVAWGLVRIPRSLFTEAAGQAPSRRYELMVTAGLAAIAVAAFEGWRMGDPLSRLLLALALLTFAAVAIGDLRYLTIPDLYSVIIAILAVVGPLSPGLVNAAIGAAVCGGMLAFVAWLWKKRTAMEGLGLGDVKLAAAMGALLSVQTGVWAIAASAAGGAALGFILQARRRDEDGPLLFPYGVALAIAGAGFLIWETLT